MTDLLQRLIKMQQAFNSEQPNHRRYRDAMSAAIDQLVLSDLPEPLRNPLEQHLVTMNTILRRYPIKTFEDYQMISSKHIHQLLDYAKKIYRLLGGSEDHIGSA